METWNEICFDLLDCKKRGTKENEYQNRIEWALRLLGWRKSNNEIRVQPEIPIGSASYIIPDIVVSKNEEDQFVIEVKHPNNIQTDRQVSSCPLI